MGVDVAAGGAQSNYSLRVSRVGGAVTDVVALVQAAPPRQGSIAPKLAG